MHETDSLMSPILRPQNKWYQVRQWDAHNEEYKVIKNAPHEHMCYKFINDNNIRNAKVVAFWW